MAILLAALLGAACAPAAPPPAEPTPVPAAEAAALAAVAEGTITTERLRDHVGWLASDEMRGRDTPSPELEQAAEYLAEELAAMGLEGAGDQGTFIQRWTFEHTPLDRDRSRAFVQINGDRREWTYGHEYFALPGPPGPAEGTPVYASDPASAMEGLPAQTRGAPLVVGLPDGLGPDFGMAIQAAMQAGASGVILLMDEETDASATFQLAGALEAGAAAQMPLPIIGLAYEVGQEFLESVGVEPRGGRDPPAPSHVLENVTLSFQSVFGHEAAEVPNVVARLPGSDPELANEYVVLTAHFDHVGVGPPDERGDSIYSGADDNASGTAAVLEAARAFSELPDAPARSILFLWVSGEEKGLLGSAHYAESPTVPQDAMVANLNLDMVSRNHPDTVYAIGEEYSTIGELVHQVAGDHPELGLTVAPDPEPEEQAFLRSDHFSFVEKGIPALMLTTWLHDDYHLPSDTPDRIDPDKAARVARLAFLLAHRLASEVEPPAWTEAGERLLQDLEQPGPP